MTRGIPVEHFALLLQEVYRGGEAVPAKSPPGSRSAGSIRPATSRDGRVAIAADIAGTTSAATPWRIRLVDLHLDAYSSWRNVPRSFGAGRVGQLQFLLEALRDDDTYTVLGGDFNSWAGGASERALRMPQEWGFVRATPLGGSTWKLRRFLGILDHVFYRLPPGASAETREIESAYGSDHRPLLGWVRLDPN